VVRPREFDFDQAVGRAMAVFWAKGYEGSSLRDLLRAMKIARGSLYKAFIDKRSVYLAALNHYDRTVVQPVIDMLCDSRGGDGATRVQWLLEGARDAVSLRNDRRGCLLCNAAVDQAPFDPEIRAKVSAMLERIVSAICTALKDSRRASRWSFTKQHEAALLIVNAYMGLRVLARSGYSPKDLTAIIDANMQGAGLRST